MRRMYDSTTAADLPADAELVAGYVDGRYKWSDADWARFPNAVKVRIAISAATDDGHVLDIEDGAAYPTQAPGWVRMRRAAGVEPSVYVNLSNEAAVRAAFRASGDAMPPVWLAHYDGSPVLPDGYIAKQYADEAMLGGHYDASVVADVWPGIDAEGGTAMETPEQTYDRIAPLLQSKIVAPAFDTFIAIKDALAALAANDATETARLIKAIEDKLAT